MKKEDKKTLIIFIILIIAIVIIWGINIYKNKPLKNVDRKIEYVMGYSYDTVLNKGEELYFQTIKLLNDKDVFEYEINLNGSIKTYVIENKTNQIKIKNFSLATNIFSRKALKDYMDLKKVIYYENSYYIENYNSKKSNYIGSTIELNSYNDTEIYFNTINYYSDDCEYIGSINDIPNCKHTTTKGKFSIKLENGLFKITDIEHFKNI